MANKKKVVVNLPQEKIQKIVLKKKTDFLNIKDCLCQRKLFFEYGISGSVETIKWDKFEYVSMNNNDVKGRGHHLNRIFRKDIDNWLSLNSKSLKPHQNDYSEQMFNLNAIENNIGKPCRAIDLNDCYWRMAFLLKYTTEKTYITGLKKKEWKTGRNACIGSLYKSKVIVPYTDGKPNYALRNRINSPVEYMYIRNHIIREVYRMFLELYEKIGDKFYMFLTDCVFTDDKSQKYVENFFNQKGFKIKSKAVDFINLDRAKRKIHWFDYEATYKSSSDNLIKKGMEKSYQYATHQIVDGLFKTKLDSNNDFLNQA